MVATAIQNVASQKRSGLAAAALKRRAASKVPGRRRLTPAQVAANKKKMAVKFPHAYQTVKTVKTPVPHPTVPAGPKPTTTGVAGTPGTPGRVGEVTTQPVQTPVVKINENGQLDLPYGENFGADMLQHQEEMNASLLDLQTSGQDQQASYAASKRDLDATYTKAKRSTLDNAAARGSVFGSSYGVGVGNDATNFNNQASDLESQNNQALVANSAGRTGIETSFNNYLRKAVLDRGVELNADAGKLGYGTNKTKPVYAAPGRSPAVIRKQRLAAAAAKKKKNKAAAHAAAIKKHPKKPKAAKKKLWVKHHKLKHDPKIKRR